MKLFKNKEKENIFKKGDILRIFLHDIGPVIYEVLDTPEIKYILHSWYYSSDCQEIPITYKVYNWTNMKEETNRLCLDGSNNVKKIGVKK